MMKRFTTLLLVIACGVGLYLGVDWLEDKMFSPPDEYRLSAFARNSIVEFGLDIENTTTNTTPEYLANDYVDSVERRLNGFTEKYGPTFNTTDTATLYETIKRTPHIESYIHMNDRRLLPLYDHYITVRQEPGTIIHVGYIPFSPKFWEWVFIILKIYAAYIVIVKGILAFLRETGILVLPSLREIIAPFRK